MDEPYTPATTKKPRRKLAERLQRSVSESVNRSINDTINHKGQYSFKRLLFDLLPDKCLTRLDERKGCFKRSLKYKLLSKGETQMRKDLDIVRLLREQKWLMAGMKKILRT